MKKRGSHSSTSILSRGTPVFLPLRIEIATSCTMGYAEKARGAPRWGMVGKLWHRKGFIHHFGSIFSCQGLSSSPKSFLSSLLA